MNMHDDKHDQLPQLPGVDMIPVNPPMPVIQMTDGQMNVLPPLEERKYLFRDGVDRPLNDKQKYLLTQAEQAFERFCNNPADKGAKKEFEGHAFSLRAAGVVLNPKYLETLKEGRKHVRDARRSLVAGKVGGA
jgi:hypothetical protein